MPRTGGDNAPKTYLVSGGWPDGTLAADAPASARYAQLLAQRLIAAHAERGHPSWRSVSRDAGVSRPTLERVLSGDITPNLGSIARLEEWFDTDLWPGPEIRALRRKRAHQHTLDQRDGV